MCVSERARGLSDRVAGRGLQSVGTHLVHAVAVYLSRRSVYLISVDEETRQAVFSCLYAHDGARMIVRSNPPPPPDSETLLRCVSSAVKGSTSSTSRWAVCYYS